MNEQRILDMMEKIWSIAVAREPVDEIFTALRIFEGKARRYNRHLSTPSPTPKEWLDLYTHMEPHAGDLARVLAENRDAFSLHLTIGLDGAAGLLEEAAAWSLDAPSIIKQFRVQDVAGKIDRVPSKLNVFLYSWGRPSLARYRGEEMERAVEHASHIEHEASYFANYLGRLLERSTVYDLSDGG